MAETSFEYDVAISFAGEQREAARELARILREHNCVVFFDEYVQADLWGKNLYEHLSDVYERKARFCLMLVSADYAAKAWTSLERQSAQARAIRAKGEYILPIRFDNTPIPGLPDTVGYLSYRDLGAERICALLLHKLQESRSVSPQNRDQGVSGVGSRPGAGQGVDKVLYHYGWYLVFGLGSLVLAAAVILSLWTGPRVLAKAPEGVMTRVNPKDGLEYALIPAGRFTMGCVQADQACADSERPPHVVTLTKSYWMSRTETTVGAYKRFASDTGIPMPPEPDTMWPGVAIPKFNPDWKLTDHPIVNISWPEASRYCAWAGGRLPTEAEWERAARGDHDGSVFPTGNSMTHDDANYGEGTEARHETAREGRDRWDYTAPVGSFEQNGFGLFDMAGNTHDWVADWFSDIFYRSPDAGIDPMGPPSGVYRVFRGGSWDHGAYGLHLSRRMMFVPDGRLSSLGVRCVLPID